MHLVALTRFNPAATLEQELQTFASALGIGLYDTRMKLAAAAPAVLASMTDAAAAQQLLALLHGRGHGAVAVDTRELASPDQLTVARSVTLDEVGLRGADVAGQPFDAPFAEIRATLRASEQSDVTQTVATQGKQLAIGRALLTGGLMLKKSVTKMETTETSERQPIAYLFRRPGQPPIVLKEQRLHYEGLGIHRGLTAHDSFEKLLAHLRAQNPAALRDDRLLTQKRKVDLTSVHGVGAERTISNSNEGANLLAAQLIVLAHEAGQL